MLLSYTSSAHKKYRINEKKKSERSLLKDFHNRIHPGSTCKHHPTSTIPRPTQHTLPTLSLQISPYHAIKHPYILPQVKPIPVFVQTILLKFWHQIKHLMSYRELNHKSTKSLHSAVSSPKGYTLLLQENSPSLRWAWSPMPWFPVCSWLMMVRTEPVRPRRQLHHALEVVDAATKEVRVSGEKIRKATIARTYTPRVQIAFIGSTRINSDSSPENKIPLVQWEKNLYYSKHTMNKDMKCIFTRRTLFPGTLT